MISSLFVAASELGNFNFQLVTDKLSEGLVSGCGGYSTSFWINVADRWWNACPPT